jgi:CRP-like cAMP-binding protein
MSRRRLRAHSVELGEIALFRGCTAHELSRIDQLVYRQLVASGTVLCRQGCFGRQSFVIVSGQAEVTIDGSPIATLGPGDFFGELSVLDGDPRTATVTALTSMALLVLHGHELESLLADVPQVARRMLATVGGRLRLANRALANRALAV